MPVDPNEPPKVEKDARSQSFPLLNVTLLVGSIGGILWLSWAFYAANRLPSSNWWAHELRVPAYVVLALAIFSPYLVPVAFFAIWLVNRKFTIRAVLLLMACEGLALVIAARATKYLNTYMP